jgi:WD40 repeat protein
MSSPDTTMPDATDPTREIPTVAPDDPDATRFPDATADGLWDTATGRPLGPPLGHRSEVRAVAFRPDGRTVLTDDAGTARAWELPAPWDGPPERARLAAICLTGLDLDEAGDFTALSADAWGRYHRRLQELGGSP